MGLAEDHVGGHIRGHKRGVGGTVGGQHLLVWEGALELVLLEGVLDDVLHVLARVFHPSHEVQQRVVAQLEGAQQRGRLAGHDLPARQPNTGFVTSVCDQCV